MNSENGISTDFTIGEAVFYSHEAFNYAPLYFEVSI